jgi:hypothetical protein
MNGMNSLIRVYLIAALAVSTSVFAGSVHDSKAVNGIYARLTWDHEGTPQNSSDKFYYGFLHANLENAPIIFFPKKEYLVRMQLFDEKGKSIPLLPLQGVLASRFSELTQYSDDVIDKRVGGSSASTPKFRRLKSDVPDLFELPSPDSIFQITNSGSYTLRCEFQVFEQNRSGTNFSYRLVRLPAIEVPILKK